MLITPFLGQRPLRPAQMAEMLVAELRHGMGDGAEIVDQVWRSAPSVSFIRAGWITHSLLVSFSASPWTGPGDGDAGGCRQRAAEPVSKAFQALCRPAWSAVLRVHSSPSRTTRPPSTSARAKRA
jgi:hypothetical protein